MKTKELFKKIYTKEYLILIGIGFLPLMWKVLEIAFLSTFENSLKILGQVALISIIFKVFEETILNPLFKTLSKSNFSTDKEKTNVAYKFLIYYSVATVLFTALLIIFNKQILEISKVPAYMFDETLQFLKLYIIAYGFGVIAKFLYTFSLINKDTKKMLVYFLIKSVATTLLFVCFVPKFALGLGVTGVAIAELTINIITIVYLTLSLPKPQQSQTKFDVKTYFKLLGLSFFETLIRNIVYYFVILVFLNMLDNQDLYFVSNEFIWSVMLVPTLAQSSLIKQELANGNNNLKPYFINSIILSLFIIVLIPIAFLTFKYVYNLTTHIETFIVLLKLLPCYFIFIIDSIIEAYFISTGKMHHVLIQSIITNILVYLTAFVLYACGIWIITLNSIILLFNLGVIISSLYTITVYLIEIYQTKKHTTS